MSQWSGGVGGLGGGGGGGGGGGVKAVYRPRPSVHSYLQDVLYYHP